MHFNIYNAFYSQYSYKHVFAAIPTIFRVVFFFTRIQMWLTVSPPLLNN